MEAVILVIVLVGGIVLYFLPWRIARARGKKHALGIGLLNLFLNGTTYGS